jgi:hypothetical protein
VTDVLSVVFNDEVVSIDLGENTSLAASSAAAAIASATAAALSAGVSAAIPNNYFPTRAAGAAATATDDLFSSDEEGEMAVYRRIAGAPNYQLVFYVSSSAPAVLATSLSARTIPAHVNSLRTAGFSAVAKGAADLSRYTPGSVEQLAGANRWLFTSNAGTVWWRNSDHRPHSLQFGHIGDMTQSYAANTTTYAGTDDWDALQAALDYACFFWRDQPRMEFSALPTRITKTLHLGYGDEFLECDLIGGALWPISGTGAGSGQLGQPGYRAGAKSGIYCDFNNLPGLNIQGARYTRVEAIALVGINYNWIAANYTTMTDRSVKANWRGPQMQADEPSAPYCGIAVDGWSFAANATTYGNQVVPAWVTNAAGRNFAVGYSKAFSSAISFRQNTTWGFEVGMVWQPNDGLDAAGNCEFFEVHRPNSIFNVTALALTGSDHRIISMDRPLLSHCHTSIDGLTYGSGNANMNGVIDGGTFDNTYQWLNINLRASTGLISQLELSNAYSEAGYRIGVYCTETDLNRAGVLKISNSQIGLRNDLRSAEYSPEWHADGNGIGRMILQGVNIGESHGLLTHKGRLTATDVRFPSIWQSPFELVSAGSIAKSFLSGLYSSAYETISVRPNQFVGYGGDTIKGAVNSHNFDITFAGQTGTPLTHRGVPIPDFVKTLGFAGVEQPIAQAPRWRLDRATTNLTGYAKATIDHTFSFALTGMPNAAHPNYHCRAGDVVFDEATEILYYVKTATVNGANLDVVLRQATRVRATITPVWSSPNTITTNAGNLLFICARRLYPTLQKQAWIKTTSGSPNADIILADGTLAGTQLGSLFFPTLAVNDYLVNPLDAQIRTGMLFPAWTKLATVVDTGAALYNRTGALVFSANALETGTFPAPLFIRCQ